MVITRTFLFKNSDQEDAPVYFFIPNLQTIREITINTIHNNNEPPSVLNSSLSNKASAGTVTATPTGIM